MERVEAEEGAAGGAEGFSVGVVGEVGEDLKEEVVGEEREDRRGLHWSLLELEGSVLLFFFLGFKG